jgi:hypothetical protein
MGQNAPVFIVGCPRSGTTLLYDMLLSSGKFVLYRAETDVFFRIAPAFGSLKSRSNRRKLLDAWLKSDYFSRSGLPAEDIRVRVLSECRDPGDFLRIVMEGIAYKQGVHRWADNTPLHLLYIAEIKKSIPNAQIVHIIRDGRDVAVSLGRLGWVDRLPWDFKDRLAISGVYWKWVVSKGREYGRQLRATDYLELRYEELVQRPESVLKTLGKFVGEDLSYEHILENALGTITRPNSSFSSPTASGPIARWKSLTEIEVAKLNLLLGPLLRELGYRTDGYKTLDRASSRLCTAYPLYWELRQALRQSPLSRLLVSRRPLQRGALDSGDARWDQIRRGALDGMHAPAANTLTTSVSHLNLSGKER